MHTRKREARERKGEERCEVCFRCGDNKDVHRETDSQTGKGYYWTWASEGSAVNYILRKERKKKHDAMEGAMGQKAECGRGLSSPRSPRGKVRRTQGPKPKQRKEPRTSKQAGWEGKKRKGKKERAEMHMA